MSTSEPLLREMRWWDIERVLGLERALFPDDAWTAGLFWSELAHTRGPSATHRYLVAEAADGSLVGYGGLATAAGTGDIQTIGVLPAYRGTGLAGRLMTELLGAAAGFGCHEVLLEVRVDNAAAQRLYERFGFVRVGVRRGYYQPGNVDAYVMRRETDPAPTDPDAAQTPEAPASPENHPGTPSSPVQGTKSHG